MNVALGKPKVEYKDLSSQSSQWEEFETPLVDSTQLEESEGDVNEVKAEGGGLIDRLQNMSSVSFTIKLVQTDSAEPPIPSVNGVITKNYAVRVTPLDETLAGFELPKCAVSLTRSYTPKEGIVFTYKFTGLVPDDGGEILVPYAKNQQQ